MKQGAAKGEVKRRRRTGYYDYNLLAAVIILICFGLVMLYSASAYEASNKFGNDMYYFGRQAVISLASVGAALAISKIDYHILSKWALHLYVLALILMAMVRFSPLGVTAGGARRWLNLGIQFQPSEIAKIAGDPVPAGGDSENGQAGKPPQGCPRSAVSGSRAGGGSL